MDLVKFDFDFKPNVVRFGKMISRRVFVCALLCVISFCNGVEEESAARLLISKHILNKYLVQDMDIVIKVSTVDL